MVKYLNLLRWKNLLIILLIIFSMKYWVFETLIYRTGFLQFPSVFNSISAFILTLSVVLVAAGGYVINDLYDTEADRINKKGKILLLDLMSEKQAQLLYFSLTLSGIALGYFVASQAGLYQLVFFHIVSATLLWVYSSYFKSSVLIGNIIVATFSALVPLCYFSFETFCFISCYGKVFEGQYDSYFIIGPLAGFWDYTLILTTFAFALTIIREIIKDLEDMEGDKKLTGQTLPLAVGVLNTLWITRLLILALMLCILYLYYLKLQIPPFNYLAFHGYLYLTLIFPGFYLLWHSFSNHVDYEKLSNILKLMMLFGTLSSFFYFTLQ